MRTVRLYYDVVCPYSYMEAHAVEAAEDAGAVEVEWLPFELRPAPKPLLEVRGDHLRVDWTQHVYRRAQALGIEIHLPRYQPRSTRRSSARARTSRRIARSRAPRTGSASRPTRRSQPPTRRSGSTGSARSA